MEVHTTPDQPIKTLHEQGAENKNNCEAEEQNLCTE